MVAGDWCILRTGGSTTLQLAKSLAEAGFEAWTPVETQRRRARKSIKIEAVTAALIPTFVFVKADRLIDLLTLSRSPSLNYRVWDSEQRRMVTKGHPRFTVFRFSGEYQLVPERALASLRLAEKRSAPKVISKVFAAGDRVRLTEGSFEGLRGIVDAVHGKFASVAFPSFGALRVPVKIGAWLLTPDIDTLPPVHVINAGNKQALFAKAA